MNHDNGSTHTTDTGHLSPLERGLGQAAWAVAVIVALFLIAGFIVTWLFEHTNDQAVADRAFIPLQAIFICFAVMLIVMAFQRCLWIGLTQKTILDEAVEMGWLLGRLGLPESDWRDYILKNRLTVFISERPLTGPTSSQVKASCFYFFKIMFGYNKLCFWTAVAQKRACFLRGQVDSVMAEIEAAQIPVADKDDGLSKEDRHALIELQNREQSLLRQVAEQAEKITLATGRNDDLAAQVQDLTQHLEANAALNNQVDELAAKLAESERKNVELDDYINRRIGGLDAEIKQKQELLDEMQDYVGKGASDKAKRAKLHRETMLLGAICLPMIERKIEEAQQKIDSGCPEVKYSLQRLDQWFQAEWPKYPQYEAAILEVIASKADPSPNLKSKKLPGLTREFLFDLLKAKGFAVGKGGKEAGAEDELWLDDDDEG